MCWISIVHDYNWLLNWMGKCMRTLFTVMQIKSAIPYYGNAMESRCFGMRTKWSMKISR